MATSITVTQLDKAILILQEERERLVEILQISRVKDLSSTPMKIVLVGDTAVGKTTFIRRHKTGEFTKEHSATMGVEVNPLTFSMAVQNSTGTTPYKVKMNIWDCAGDPRFSGLGNQYYFGAQGAIVMFDLTSWESWKSVDKHIKNIRDICGGIPIVLCGNKCDSQLYGSAYDHIALRQFLNEGVVYYDTSAKSNYNFEKPFLTLARKITNELNLNFSESLAVKPPEAPPLPAGNPLMGDWCGTEPRARLPFLGPFPDEWCGTKCSFSPPPAENGVVATTCGIFSQFNPVEDLKSNNY